MNVVDARIGELPGNMLLSVTGEAMRILILGKVALVALLGLPPQPGDTLEVAAIHPSRADSLNTRIDPQPGGRLVIVNATLRTLIRNAYGALPFQLVGEPKWSESDRFDINAKNASGQQITQDTLKPLLQGLLADRFQLEAHWETRQAPVYALLVEEHGPKFKAHADESGGGMNTSRVPGKVVMHGSGVPMADLAGNLGFHLQRYVIDETHLSGRYDFLLHWDPDGEEDSTEPSLATAMHEQLGLRLKPGRGAVQVLVIERAERPTEN
jgi:uncharacterized protein (TIGR03435 family)